MNIYFIYILLQERFEMAHILDGHVQGAHFGYTIASGDLDADGYDGNSNLLYHYWIV